MPELERVGSLEVHQDLDFQRREWLVQKIGWGFMFLFLAAAMTGFFGAGPASTSTAGDQGSALWVDYERFGRRGASITMRVHARPAAGEFKLLVDRGYMEAVRVQQITPEPASHEVSGAWLIYTFQAAEPGAETAVTFELQGEQVGRLRARVQAEGQNIEFAQFIYP